MGGHVFGLDLPAVLVIGDRLGYNSPWLIPLLAELEHGMLRGQMINVNEAASAKKSSLEEDDGQAPRSPVSSIDTSFLQIGEQE